MTQHELSQMRILNREIACKKDRLHEFEILERGGRQKITGLARLKMDELTPTLQESIGILRRQIELDLLKCMGLLLNMENFISSIDDSQLRMILSLRYINGLSWQQIAFSIGEHDEQYPRRLNNAFFKKQNATNTHITLAKKI